ncbi:MAG: hypothetical protein WBL65_18715, partial [Bryobacteraceae bacterium]
MKTLPAIDPSKGGTPAESPDMTFRTAKKALPEQGAERKRYTDEMKGERNRSDLGHRKRDP